VKESSLKKSGKERVACKMRNKLIRRMYIVLIINVVLVAASVFGIVYFMLNNAMIEDIQQRAIGATDFIVRHLNPDHIKNIGEDNQIGDEARQLFEQLETIMNLERLYVADVKPNGDIDTKNADKSEYILSERLEADLRKSLDESEPVFGSRIYKNNNGIGVYSVFWPVFEESGARVGVICMEFDTDIIYQSNSNAAIYSVALSGTLIILFFIIAFLAMSRASEPFYKKLAYTDVLTGYENRMAFEHRMRECHAIADRGESVAIIVCDVNNLKTVNDVQGHEAGDKYLQLTADILFEHLPKGSPFYRIGGDEYATILVGIKEYELYDLMQRYQEENRPTVKNQPFSCACGAALFTRGIDENMRDVFKRADEAMYVEKKRQKALLGQELR
jgi:diguanylate cyclase (GGDEF)-like protein